ncbi:hypothetical protein S40293_01885 [Stachybotrys chartarum IBT 40293]|nr:hypothetical protein S40293_01885 [Stachybotrys chartarum IBT 40293]
MSDEVSQFLEQVERLRGQQPDDDEQIRAREREEYLAAKRERQARREERARSISPQKSSPANTPSPRSSHRPINLSDAVKLESPTAPTNHARALSFEAPGDSYSMASGTSPTKENQSPMDPDAKQGSGALPHSRASPLSWQRRPNSRGGSRPLSMVALQNNATQRSLGGPQEPHSATEDSFSRDQIAQALGSKDPGWFRQTADRGVGSAAFRRNQVEDNDRLDMSSARAQLPGMSNETTRESPAAQSIPDKPTHGRLASPPLLSPSVELEGSEGRRPADTSGSTLAGRTSPVRSTSPTKGMGGFVQSAMMKRSDSVKRWSVASPPKLTRADPIASNRPSHTRTGSQIGNTSQNSFSGRPTTPSTSRPASRHGEKEQVDEPTVPLDEPTPQPASAPLVETKQPDTDAALPVSPSKTMDQRRWSPTKTSWLESALRKPESPKLQSKPATPSQPSWRVDLKNQAERTNSPSSELGRNGSLSHRHQVSIGGLMRSSPMGAAAKPNPTGLGGIYSPPPGGNRPAYGHGSQGSMSRVLAKTEDARPEEDHEATQGSIVASEGEATEPAKPSSVTSLSTAAPKAKPATPPKKDFRSNLKARSTEPASSTAQQPEFKNVFGTLRKTKTQNYVAPDELKDNILRGKAALNLTGGPQKTERKDEFKDAILKKKEDFKRAQTEGKGITRSSTAANARAVPEGIARRAELGNPIPGSKPDVSAEAKPRVVSANKPGSPKPTPGPKRVASSNTPDPNSPTSPQHADDTQPRRSNREVVAPTISSASAAPRALPGLQRQTASGTDRFSTRPTGGKLADRFNPTLAGILARGPPPMASMEANASEDSAPRATSTTDSSTEPPAPGPQLTHMTKGRARGPKRKAPSSVAASTGPKTTSNNDQPPRGSASSPFSSSTIVVKPEIVPTTQTDFSKSGNDTRAAASSIQQQVAVKAATRSKPIPLELSQDSSDNTRALEDLRPTPLRRRPSSPEKPAFGRVSPLKPHKTGDASSQPGSPKKLDMKRMSRFIDEAEADKPNFEVQREPVRLTHQRTGSRSPVKLAERPLPDALSFERKPSIDVATPLKSSSPTLGKPNVKSPPLKPKPSFDKLAKAAESPKFRPTSSARPLPAPPADAKSPPPLSLPARSPTKQASEIATLLNDFFGPDRPTNDYKVDPAEVLMNHPTAADKIRSSGFQVFQISGDGKKTPVASHNERVLFEKEMYICPHEFAGAGGRPSVEVYFWVGDEVADSEAEDAMLFAQREARALGGKLVKVRQGKETANFLQAMGGIVIIRRGSTTKYDSLAPSIVCGRRCLGQVAFDEVDFASSSLCSGFPYLITHSGRCYLWKGKGSDVDELGCARLVGMELTLTGELLEVDEGNETEEFWGMFDGGSKPHSADHWRLKPTYGKYCSRLFCSDADSRQQIFEISPFSQADLSPLSIYVLDAFFEIYIVVGSRAQSQYASFRNALNFAQEYAILAAGMEDRPFVPVATVVLEGIPRDLKSVFRKWSDALSPTVMNAGGSSSGAAGLRRGKSLKVVPLTQALRALNE